MDPLDVILTLMRAPYHLTLRQVLGMEWGAALMLLRIVGQAR